MYFPKYIVQRREKVSISRAHFTLCLKPTKIEHLGKNPQNNENSHADMCVFEQKPMKIDDFIDAEEKEVKECVENQKEER